MKINDITIYNFSYIFTITFSLGLNVRHGVNYDKRNKEWQVYLNGGFSNIGNTSLKIAIFYSLLHDVHLKKT